MCRFEALVNLKDFNCHIGNNHLFLAGAGTGFQKLSLHLFFGNPSWSPGWTNCDESLADMVAKWKCKV